MYIINSLVPGYFLIVVIETFDILIQLFSNGLLSLQGKMMKRRSRPPANERRKCRAKAKQTIATTHVSSVVTVMVL